MQKFLNKLLIVCSLFIFFCIFSCKGQSLKTDLGYLTQLDTSVTKTVIQGKKASVLKRYNPILLLLNGSLKGYQKVISPQFSANCLYELSCSRFSQAAIQEYGIVKGLALTADRLARCNRISASTINPYRVNEKGKVIDSPNMYKLD